MPSIHMPGMIIDYTNSYRLRLEDGRRVFMDWHHWCGPTFFSDKAERRMIDEWYDDPLIVKALDWFLTRGKKA